MDHLPLCAWCGLEANAIPGALFRRRVVRTSDRKQRVHFGLHYRTPPGDGTPTPISCDDEDPLARPLWTDPIPGAVLRDVEDRGKGRVLVFQKATKKRLRPARAGRPGGSSSARLPSVPAP